MSASQVYSGFDAPHDLAIDQAGNLYVADVFDADHALPNPPDSTSSRVAVIATPLSNTAVSYELPNVAYPLGMDFDAAGNLYVALCVGPYPCDGGGKLLVFNAPAAQPGTIALQVNAVAARRPISPYIYGLNSYGLSTADLRHAVAAAAAADPALGRQHHQPLQLEERHGQPRQRLVLREHP